MSRALVLRAAGTWLPFAVCGVLNGILKESVLVPLVGAGAGHAVSTAILCAVVLIGSWLFVKHLNLTDSRSLLSVGLLWLVLTVAFEFIFGHYVMGNPWERLLADYNVLRGRLWVLVLVSEALGPLAMAKLRR